MLSKFLERQVELFTNDEDTELKSPIQLQYFLLESEEQETVELIGEKVYGIEIVKKESDGSLESEWVRNLTCCRESARSVLDKLADHQVTPITLLDIVDDMLAQ
ncbi:MAG: DUF6514 family protein [Clostridia bacterium]|nr:DUF6514 family protein [Clostridia bacterium]